MRSLRRPMFRYGGDVKAKGVMHGMKNMQDGGPATMADATGYAGGGMTMPDMRGRVTGPGGYAGKKKAGFKLTDLINPLKLTSMPAYYGLDQAIAALTPYSGLFANGGIASLPTKAALVGNPVYPKTNGREHHRNVLSLFNIGTKGGAAAAKPGLIRSGISNFYNQAKKVPGFLASKMTKSVPNVVRDKSGRIISEGTKAVPTYFGRDPGVKAIGAIYKGITSPTAKGYLQKGAQIATSPSALLAGATFSDVLPGGKPLGKDDSGLFGFGNLLGQKYDKDGKKMTGVFGRDIGYNKEKVLTEEQKQIKALQDQLAGFNKKKTPEEIKKLEEDKLKRIYNLLGVDRAQRNAASKALADVSRYIDEGGKDTISKKNIASTLTKGILAFDKRLDKVDQLKEAAGLMLAKGEIAEMGDPLGKKYKQLNVDKLEKEARDSKDPRALKFAIYDSKGKTLTHDGAIGLAKTNNPKAVVLADAKQAKDAGVGDTISAVDYVTEQIKTQGGDVAGVYVVDKAIIKVDDQGNTTQMLP